MTSFVDTVCFCVIVHFLCIENLDQITIYLIDQGLHYYNNTRPTQIHVTPPSIPYISLCKFSTKSHYTFSQVSSLL